MNLKLYCLGLSGSGLSVATDSPVVADINLNFVPYNIYDDSVIVEAAIFQTSDDDSLESLKLRLIFVDALTDDVIYQFTGTLDDESNHSIVAVMEASGEFESVELNVNVDAESIASFGMFNGLDSLGRNSSRVPLPAGTAPTVDLFQTLTQLDYDPSTLYMQFRDDVKMFTDMVRVANKLNTRLWVELDPTLTAEQALQTANDLAPHNHRVRFLWSPVVARPANAVGLRGKKVPRIAGGYVVAQHMLRDARTNAQGVPPLHQPIAGFDYPLNYVGMEMRADVNLSDPMRKKLADAQINVVQRVRYRNGVRFVIGDALSAYGDNNSILKLTASADIAMFIDNNLVQIVHRHLLKATEDTIADATKEARRLLDACTSKDRKLLVHSDELGGFYQLSITPRDDRPYDAIDVKCSYRPHGTTRAAFFETTVTK